MIEIKFRIWNDKTKGFCSLESSLIMIDEINDLKQHLKLSQFTGLKDKNGTFICEGDYVKYHENIYLIKKNDYMFYAENFWDSSQDIPTDFFSEKKHSFSEIIGNIHLNPELL